MKKNKYDIFLTLKKLKKNKLLNNLSTLNDETPDLFPIFSDHRFYFISHINSLTG